jgi:hypothetical protein
MPGCEWAGMWVFSTCRDTQAIPWACNGFQTLRAAVVRVRSDRLLHMSKKTAVYELLLIPLRAI